MSPLRCLVAVTLGALLALSPLRAAAADEPAVSQADRVEIVASRRDDWKVIPLGQDGLLLVGEDKGGQLTLSRYDTDFKLLWTRDWEASARAEMEGSWVEGGAAWFLLHRYKKASFTLLRVDLETGKPTARELRSPVKTKWATGLLVDQEDAYLMALSKTRELFGGDTGSLLHVDLGTNEVARVDVAEAAGVDELRFERLTAGPEPGHVSITGAVDERRNRTLYVLDLKDGRVSGALTVRPDEGDEQNLLRATKIPLAGDDALVVGTWASGLRDLMAQGMYLSRYDGNNREWIRYHDFTSFQHFFDYLPEGRRARMQRKIERKAKNDQDVELDYLLRLHAPMLLTDRTVLVAEAYYPEYRTYTTTTTTTVNGVTTTRTTTTRVFAGFRYTHAVVAAFDQQGQLLWDASVPIGNVLSPTVRDHVAVQVQGDHIRMLYCVSGKVYTLEAYGDEVRGEKAEQRLLGESEDEKVKASWGSRSAWWYDDWFLVWGHERVKGDGERRTVFAFTKVGPGGD